MTRGGRRPPRPRPRPPPASAPRRPEARPRHGPAASRSSSTSSLREGRAGDPGASAASRAEAQPPGAVPVPAASIPPRRRLSPAPGPGPPPRVAMATPTPGRVGLRTERARGQPSRRRHDAAAAMLGAGRGPPALAGEAISERGGARRPCWKRAAQPLSRPLSALGLGGGGDTFVCLSVWAGGAQIPSHRDKSGILCCGLPLGLGPSPLSLSSNTQLAALATV